MKDILTKILYVSVFVFVILMTAYIYYLLYTQMVK